MYFRTEFFFSGRQPAKKRRLFTLPPLGVVIYGCGTVLTWQVAEPSSHSSMVGMTQL